MAPPFAQETTFISDKSGVRVITVHHDFHVCAAFDVRHHSAQIPTCPASVLAHRKHRRPSRRRTNGIRGCAVSSGHTSIESRISCACCTGSVRRRVGGGAGSALRGRADADLVASTSNIANSDCVSVTHGTASASSTCSAEWARLTRIESAATAVLTRWLSTLSSLTSAATCMSSPITIDSSSSIHAK